MLLLGRLNCVIHLILNNRLIIVIIILNLTIADTKAQNTNTRDIGIDEYVNKLRSTEELVHNHDWNAVANQWQDIIALNPSDGEMWYRYGESLYFSNKPIEATDAF